MAVPMLRIDAPKRFGAREIVMIQLFSVAAVSTIVSFLGIVILLNIWTMRNGNPVAMFSFSQLTTPVGVIILYFSVMPFLMANPYIRYLLQKQFASNTANTSCYDCQITLSPRLYRGFRGFIEDADDIGRLEITRDALVFTGDHIHIYLPFNSIASAMSENCGGRRLWILGNRILIRTDDLTGLTGFYLYERQSNTTAGSHHIAKELFRALQQRINCK